MQMIVGVRHVRGRFFPQLTMIRHSSGSPAGATPPPASPGDLDFSNFNPYAPNDAAPQEIFNLLDGKWVSSKQKATLVDPLTGSPLLIRPETKSDELEPFLASMRRTKKHGLHNPLKNPERYRLYGDVSAKLAAELRKDSVNDHFVRLIQRVAPKSYAQAKGEVDISRTFLENFSGDQVRFLARGFHVSGDYTGQQSQGYRWPFGAVALIAPFNFPLEIPVLQLMGALYMGNHVTLKCASTTSMVMEEWLRLMHKCGAPTTDVNFIHTGGRTMRELIAQAAKEDVLRTMLFTGSSDVAEDLAELTRGKIKVEDAGFDWKILGADVQDMDYVAFTSDQDAYAHTGQKCSAQSIMFAHTNWEKAGLFDKMSSLAGRRSLDNLTVGPVLSHTNKDMLDHMNSLLQIPGAKVVFGGKELTGHSIPSVYGAFQPTAVYVPLKELASDAHFKLCTTEIFGPMQVVTTWESDDDLEAVLECLERMQHHLTAAVVSNNTEFVNKVLANSVNGTTYAGIRARTTGAPQNHWFGPAGDPRGAGIGSPEAIRLVWSCHREIIHDTQVPAGWALPQAS